MRTRPRITSLITFVAPLFALSALVAMSGPVQAHTLTTARPGSAAIDLGDLDDLPPGGRLIHATLDTSGDSLTLSYVPSGHTSMTFELLIPDVEPEHGATGANLPRLQAAPALASATNASAVGSTLVDATTAISYTHIELVEVPSTSAGAAAPRKIVVRRGDAPSRVAVRIVATGSDEAFATDDPELAPTSVAAANGWFATAPASSPKREVSDRATVGRYVIIPGSIAFAMIVCTAWWVRRGRARSRIRGAERAND